MEETHRGGGEGMCGMNPEVAPVLGGGWGLVEISHPGPPLPRTFMCSCQGPSKQLFSCLRCSGETCLQALSWLAIAGELGLQPLSPLSSPLRVGSGMNTPASHPGLAFLTTSPF